MNLWRWLLIASLGVVRVGGVCSALPKQTLGQEDWWVGIEGSWKQVLSSKYVVDTNLIDMQCVSVSVSVQEDPLRLTVHQQAILHGYHSRTTNQTYTLSNPRWMDGFITFHKERNLDYQLRCLQKDLIIWTGTDDMTLAVWALDASVFYREWKDDVSDFLKRIDYQSRYKEPLSTFNETTCRA